MIFDYPESQQERVHEPAGYVSYESFRPWLRDEFTFRCVCRVRFRIEPFFRLAGANRKSSISACARLRKKLLKVHLTSFSDS